VNIVDDYAHHPTEVRVTIEAVREGYNPKRTWVVFQPHQQTRTKRLMDEFADCFGGADEIIVPDVYAARESKSSAAHATIESCARISSRTDRPAEACSKELVSRIRRSGGRARYLPSLGAVADYLIQHVREGDLVLTMGAGDVGKVADELVDRICEPNRA
jgi:UDP-N-acetylmuramate--alanine ligase